MKNQIKKLRQQGKNPVFCQEVTNDEFDEILALLKDNYQQNLNEAEILDLLATLANIILINRKLHYEHFTPNCSKELFKVIINLIDDSTRKQESKRAESKEFNFVAAYRLVFLILYDSKEINEQYLKHSNEVLKRAFTFYSKNFEQYNKDTSYQLSFNELLKSLYTLYHQHADLDKLVGTAECIQVANRVLNFQRIGAVGKELKKRFTDLEMMLMKSILNFNLILLGEYKLDDGDDDYDVGLIHSPRLSVDELKECSLTFTNLAYFLEFALESYDTQNESKHTSKKSNSAIVLADLLAVLAIFRVDYKRITSSINQLNEDGKDEQDSSFTKSVLELKQRYWEYFIPSEKHNKLYNQLFQLTLLSHPTVSLNTSEITHAAHIRSLIYDLYFELCKSNDLQGDKIDSDGQLELFLQLFGYSHSIPFFLNSNRKSPSEEMKQRYMNPSSQFLRDCPTLSTSGKNLQSSEIIDSLFNRQFSSMSTSERERPEKLEEPMTPEEKEREAEKLFTLLGRVEKDPLFEGFVNPVREWQQSGKFEDIE
ncbi:hypothetical protein CLIB1423_04S06678 [[Candida] railenensis]|uniref:Uncharacterized protein n=1 Tax=[Candida] railenensis TaxID=45579 RepID=A0A9P0QNQ0_9ASCO|nr:hypothetical protein CLIB1423_04S06678 [[Candida] railenensis]